LKAKSPEQKAKGFQKQKVNS